MNRKKNPQRNLAACFEHEDFTLSRLLGRGGNGEVWLATSPGGATLAVKFLTEVRGKRYERFRSEVGVLRSLGGLVGVVPLVASNLPAGGGRHQAPWYAMPVAETTTKVLRREEPHGIVEAMVEIAAALETLHATGVAHRDVKPDNILRHHGRWCLSDFGLAEWPGARDLTSTGESVGPRWTIAPEMRRSAQSSAGPPADVFSLAKTLWILLTGQTKGFDGQYSPSVRTLDLGTYTPIEYLRPLHSLLGDATHNEPQRRPSMAEFKRALQAWLMARDSFHERGLLEWRHMQRWLFPGGSPDRATWHSPDDIVRVLNAAVATKNLNHCLFSSGGGMDLEGCKVLDDGTLELDVGYPVVLRPELLEAVLWKDAPEWSYFFLEAASLAPSGIYTSTGHDYEELLRLKGGQLYSRAGWDDGQYTDSAGRTRNVPPGSEVIMRYLRGAFVVFAKPSPYNLDPSTYDGRHARMGRERFFKYIRGHVTRQLASGPLSP